MEEVRIMAKSGSFDFREIEKLQKQIERLEQENKILRDMLSDIQESVQKLDKASTATSEEHIRETYRMIGCIRHITGSFNDRMSAEKYRRGNSEGGQV